MKRRVCLAFALVLVSGMSRAQVSIGGEPSEWGTPQLQRQGLPEVGLSLPDPEDLGMGPANGDFRYGLQRTLEADVTALGRWDVLADGSHVCRIVLRSQGAVMLSVQFDRWELDEDAVVYLYNEARTHFIGGFDDGNRGLDGTMATAVLPGEAVVIEYRTPFRSRGTDQLRVSSVTHGFLDLFQFTSADEERDYDPGYQSSPCQININCPEGATWQQQKRSVAMFLRPDGNGCTGNLVNNTQTPGRPFFHMANHCYTATANQWVFYFNYESPTCVGSTGPTTATMTGATLRANYYYTDMCLVELNSTPPANYNVYYAGWDRSGAVPQSSVVIEHPLYDVKKIAVNNNPSTSFTDAIGVPCWRGTWEQGLVQSVASGAPLFDQNKRMVGHMYDGAQVCSTATSIPSDFAKFSAGWDGTAASTRMRDWLNPANNVMTMDGYDPNASATVSLRLKAYLEGPYSTGTSQMNATLRSSDLLPNTEPYTGLGYTHAGGGGGETTNGTVLGVTGSNAVVDWVVVELRNSANSAQVLATRSAVIQADGDVVAANDGTSALSFNASSGSYFIALRHRNHLGIMTAAAVALSSTTTALDLSNGSVPLYGGANATKVVGTRNAMFAGDVTRSSSLQYVGSGNDRDPILVRIGGVLPTASTAGYHLEDVNLDGVVLYTGSNNDRDPILVNIGGTVPTASRNAQLP